MKILGILGATGVGKSAVAVQVAKKLKCDVLSADSMQVYKDMNIGTAKITSAEMQGVTHHMLDVVTPDVNFSAQDYCDGALRSTDGCDTIVMAGGTGFYFDCLLYPLDFQQADTKALREKLNGIYAREGKEKLWEMLKEQDLQTYNTIDLNNIKRVVRALELALSGHRKSEGQGGIRKCAFEHKLYVLNADRQYLYDNADKRIDGMIQEGLVQEVRDLLAKYNCRRSTSMQAIGYKEILNYIDGNCTLNEAVQQLKLNTRHYIKRQLTYFKRMNAMWLDVLQYGNPETIAQVITQDFLASF